MMRLYTKISSYSNAVHLTVVVLLILAVFTVLFSYLQVEFYGKYVSRDVPQGVKIGIVLGGGIADGQPRPLLKDRLDTAAGLIKTGQLRKLIVSGDNRFLSYNETEVMYDYLVEQHNLNPNLIQRDNAGRSTYESCERAAKVFELKSVVLISESTHLPRAVYLCRQFNINAYGYSSNGRSAEGLQVGQRFREVMARTKAILNVYIIGERTVLGEKITI